MDAVDAGLMEIVQREVPLAVRPFEAIGRRGGVGESECIERLARLRALGVFRRIGPSFDVRRFGGASVLAAVRRRGEAPAGLAAFLIGRPEVTHVYERDDPEFRLWFTVSSLRRAAVPQILGRCREFPGVEEVLDFPAKTTFKIRVFFPVAASGVGTGQSGFSSRSGEVFGEGGAAEPTAGAGMDGQGNAEAKCVPDVGLIRALEEEEFPLVSRPYRELGGRCGMNEDEVLDLLQRWRVRGALRRIAGYVRPGRVGFHAAAMVVWEVSGSEVGAAGRRAAGFPWVSHCYERVPQPGFPGNLFAMVHARDGAELGRRVEAVSETIGVAPRRVLRTLRRRKHSAPRLAATA